MNILLISANKVESPYPVYPIGLDYVAQSIPSCHNVQIIDMNTVIDDEDLSQMIASFSPEIVGISLRNIDNTDATDPIGFVNYYKTLIQTVRNATRALVVLGGSGFTIFARELMSVLNADYGIVGEGERFSLFVDAIINQKDPCQIPGVVGRTNAQTPLPLPEAWQEPIIRSLPKQNAYLSHYLQNGGMLNLQSKRGCKYKCVYCTYPHIEGKTMRLIHPEEVGKTAYALEQAGAKYFFITDSTFNSDIDHSLAVAKEIKRAGVTIPWGAFFAPIQLPDDYFKTMSECGLKHVEFGTDAFSDPVLASYRKPFRVKDIYEAHNNAIDAQLYVAHFLVLGGPGETQITLDETFSNIDKLKRTVLFFFCGMRIYPYTKLYEIAVKQGQISDSETLLEPVFYKTEELDSNDIIRQVAKISGNRRNWIHGSGGSDTINITSKMYQRGYTGPLWEYLIR